MNWGFKFIINFLQFFESFVNWESEISKFFSKVCNFGLTAILKVIMDFFYHLLDSIVNVFAIFIVIDLGLHVYYAI